MSEASAPFCTRCEQPLYACECDPGICDQCGIALPLKRDAESVVRWIDRLAAVMLGMVSDAALAAELDRRYYPDTQSVRDFFARKGTLE